MKNKEIYKISDLKFVKNDEDGLVVQYHGAIVFEYYPSLPQINDSKLYKFAVWLESEAKNEK